MRAAQQSTSSSRHVVPRPPSTVRFPHFRSLEFHLLFPLLIDALALSVCPPPPPPPQAIALIGEFNNWDPKTEHWAVKNDFGVFQLFLPDAPDGTPAIKHRWAGAPSGRAGCRGGDAVACCCSKPWTQLASLHFRCSAACSETRHVLPPAARAAPR